MKVSSNDRRRFIRNASSTLGGMAILSTLPGAVRANADEYVGGARPYDRGAPRIKFAVIGINHTHIHSLIEVVTRGGGQLVSYFAKEADLATDFGKRYPQAKLAANEKEILEDKSIHLILSAAIPDDRALIAVDAMRHGKDFMVDKPGIATLEQLAQVRSVQKETGRIYSILFGRLENAATIKAAELVKAGAIGKVIQTIALAPHRVNPKTRPDWFYDAKRYGGIINDIGSHQFDEYLFFTGSSKVEIVASQAGNVNHRQYPLFEDFGDVMLKGDGGMGYLRVDWFTPDGLKTWGDDRLTILGTEGYIEVRKNIDLAGRPGDNHLFLVDHKETRYFNCSNAPLPYGELFVNDIINRTQTAMLQEHCFLASELALKAQKQAKNCNLET